MRGRYNVTLHKIRSIHQNLALDKYTGSTGFLPKVGQIFMMWTHQAGELWTTPATKVYEVIDSETGRKATMVETKNSLYALDIEDTEKPNESPIQGLA